MSSLKDLNFLIDTRLTVDDLNIEVEYIIPNFLIKQTLNLYYARGGIGKSFLALTLAINLLNKKLIDECIYIDMDNSAVALKARNLDKVIKENENLIYCSWF